MKLRHLYILLLIFQSLCLIAQADDGKGATRVLVIIAHPDDESVFSVTLYKIAKENHGQVDIAVITNGEAGYKYSTLAESVYGKKLCDESTGRANLPRIRKHELKNAGKILGIHRYYFFGQLDAHFTTNEHGPIDTNWNIPYVKNKLIGLLKKNHYNLVLTLLPKNETHGAHNAAAILALDAINSLGEDERPVILAAETRAKPDPVCYFKQYKDYVLTRSACDTAVFCVDRTQSFSYMNRINYKVIANWEIAEHKSQGYTQMTMNSGDIEEFWSFKINGVKGLKNIEDLFENLKKVPLDKYYKRTY